MSLYEIIKNKNTEAIKAQNKLLRSAYGNVLAKILVAEKSGKYSLPLEDTVVESLIVKEIKELEETRSFYQPIQDQYEDISVQIAELNQYLPKMLTDEEVECLVVECIPECQSPVTKGKLVGMVAKRVGNRFDKSRIKEIVDRVVE